jgi:hypothetical protein
MQRLAEREGYGFLAYLLAITHVEALETVGLPDSDPSQSDSSTA